MSLPQEERLKLRIPFPALPPMRWGLQCWWVSRWRVRPSEDRELRLGTGDRRPRHSSRQKGPGFLPHRPLGTQEAPLGPPISPHPTPSPGRPLSRVGSEQTESCCRPTGKGLRPDSFGVSGGTRAPSRAPLPTPPRRRRHRSFYGHVRRRLMPRLPGPAGRIWARRTVHVQAERPGPRGRRGSAPRRRGWGLGGSAGTRPALLWCGSCSPGSACTPTCPPAPPPCGGGHGSPGSAGMPGAWEQALGKPGCGGPAPARSPGWAGTPDPQLPNRVAVCWRPGPRPARLAGAVGQL